jgi:hypothetical protein
MKTRKMNEFKVIKEHKSVDGSFTHTITELKKLPPADLSGDLPEKYTHSWFAKTYKKNDPIAFREVVAQEFFRLVALNHPKTRFIEDKANDYVLSKGIEGIKLLSDLPLNVLKKNLGNGTYTGLGSIAFLALFFNEIDLKFGNIAINNKNQLIKLDGEQCFAVLQDPERERGSAIDEEDIRSLPCLVKYMPWNWLDFVVQGEDLIPRLIDLDPDAAASFRQDVHGAMLRCLLLPNSLIEAFIHSYVKNDAQKIEAASICELMCKRKKQLLIAALTNVSFMEYMQKFQVTRYVAMYAAYLATFKTTQKHFLKDKLTDLSGDIGKEFNALERLMAIQQQKKPPKFAVGFGVAASLSPSVSVGLKAKYTAVGSYVGLNKLSMFGPSASEQRISVLIRKKLLLRGELSSTQVDDVSLKDKAQIGFK